MKALCSVAAALMLSAPSGLQHGPVYSGLPPERMRGDSIGIVAYVTDVEAYCGHREGMTTLACVRKVKGVNVQFLPNPCILGDVEVFARLACHEAAHQAHNWSANHEL